MLCSAWHHRLLRWAAKLRRAELYASHRHIEAIAARQSVTLPAVPARRAAIVGEVRASSLQPVQSLPEELVRLQQIAIDPITQQPFEPTYRIDIEFDEATDLLPLRCVSIARVWAQPESMLTRIVRFVSDSLGYRLPSGRA
ncbi:MAG: hypothetical protein R3C05_19465 [Pirellulaceae bacterium]